MLLNTAIKSCSKLRSLHNCMQMSLRYLCTKTVIPITFIQADGSKVKVDGYEGESVLQVAHRVNIPLEGACDSSLACSTCHVIVDSESFDKLPEAVEEEEDMLDLAPQLSATSRLGCQIILTPKLKNMVLTLPKITRNFYVDGHVPEPH